MDNKVIDCGCRPAGMQQIREVDCGFNPQKIAGGRRGTTEGAGPERATTEASVPAAPAVKHSRKS